MREYKIISQFFVYGGKFMIKQNKENNKGFSLIELIVVMAIMVVLIGVLSSAVLGYVNKAKTAKDIQAADELGRAVRRCLLYSNAITLDNKYMTGVGWNSANPSASGDDGSLLDIVCEEMGGTLPLSSLDEDYLWILQVYYSDSIENEENLVVNIYLGPSNNPNKMMKGAKIDSQYMLYPEVGSYWK